jgi:hypothetical protein
MGSVLAASLLGLPNRAAASSSDAGFLEQSLPSPFSGPDLKISSFREGITLLAQLSGKRIVLPEGIADWLNERPEKNWQASTTVSKDEKVRPVFEDVCQILGMNWRYDADKDAIFLDFKWRRDDPRTTKELVSILVDARPVDWTQLPHDAPTGLDGFALDDWRRAFDALLSKPENFPSCSRLRLYHDSHSSWAGIGFTPVVNIFAEKMQDDSDRNEIVILNKQERMCGKDCPGDLAYYIFDEDGKFIRGGVYAMAEGFEGDVVSAKVDYDNHISVAVGWGTNASNPDYVHFALKQDDLVLEGSTTCHGTFKNADETRSVSSNDVTGGLGLLKYSISRQTTAKPLELL